MNNLEKALSAVELFLRGKGGLPTRQDLTALHSAARKWDNLPSDENIEKAAMKLYDLEGEGRFTDATWNPSWESEDEGVKEEYRAAAEAVLRSVGERERRIHRLQKLVAEQTEDEGLWFLAVTASEAYLQQELRRLHALIEEGTE